MIVVDPVNGRLHEFWQARLTDAGWQASQASTFDLASNRLRPEGWTSADAAGLPIFPAVVRYDEVARGRYRSRTSRHRASDAARLRLPGAPLCQPADRSALPRMGERLRLRRDFDIADFPPHARAILRALKATACSSPTTAATGSCRSRPIAGFTDSSRWRGSRDPISR